MGRIKIFFLLLRGRNRRWWGYCPKCNGDAPEAYDCTVCDGFHVRWRYQKPSGALKWGWHFCYKHELLTALIAPTDVREEE